MLARSNKKRDDVVRAAVLQPHTATEDLGFEECKIEHDDHFSDLYAIAVGAVSS
jgi:hypothetical protein